MRKGTHTGGNNHPNRCSLPSHLCNKKSPFLELTCVDHNFLIVLPDYNKEDRRKEEESLIE
jgi:hypothetical protein